MTKQVLVPQLNDFENVDVIDVLVGEGDLVSVGDALITIETDKASMDIPSTDGGIVKEFKLEVGDKVSSGSLILLLEESGESSLQVAVDAPSPTVVEDGALSESTSGSGALRDISVPEIGEFDAVDVIEVLVAVGDVIAAEDSLITLETDKASMDVPSPAAGVVREVYVNVGDKVSIGSPIVSLESSDGAEPTAATAAPAVPAAADTAPATKPQAAAGNIDAQQFKRVHASPSVRRIAREMGVDLAGIQASGPHARVTAQDVYDSQKSGGAAPAQGGAGLPAVAQRDWERFGPVVDVPLSRINRLSAKHLQSAWLNVPHVTHFDEADITELEAYRQEVKGLATQRGYSFTPLVFMMKAVVAGLKEFPRFNSAMSESGENLIQREYYNLGIAVDTPDGLVVPVIRDVDRKGLLELAGELAELSLRARDGKLKADDMQGGCFSISSLGGIAGTNFTPIVNAPEVGIVGVTPAKTRLERCDGKIVDRLIQPLAVSYDHRVIDGAYASRFLSHVAFILSDIRNISL